MPILHPAPMPPVHRFCGMTVREGSTVRKWIAGSMVVAALALAACGGAPSSADTGSGSEPAASEQGGGQQSGEARHQIGKTYEVGGLKVTIGEIVVQKDRVIVGMTLENTADHTLSFFPDQGHVVVGNMQLEANPFMTEGEVSGEIAAGVKKEGVVHFLAPEGKSLDPAQVKEVRLNLGDVFDDEKMEAREFSETVAFE